MAAKGRVRTVGDVVERFVAGTHISDQNPWRAALIRLARSRADGGLGDLPLDELCDDVAGEYLSSIRPLDARAARLAFVQVVRFACEETWIDRARGDQLRRVRVRDETRCIETFTLAELDRVAACLLAELAPLPRFGVATGLRCGEMAALRWDDLTLGDEPVVDVRRAVDSTRGFGEPMFSRTGGWRTVPLCDLALEALDMLPPRDGRDLLFGRMTAAGEERHRTPQQLGHLWRDACGGARVRFRTLNVVRQTFAVENLRQGVPLQVLADWMGISTRSVRELAIPLDRVGWRPWPQYRRR